MKISCKNLFASSMVAALLLSSVPAQAGFGASLRWADAARKRSFASSSTEVLKKLTLAMIVASVGYFNLRKPTNDPVRYDLEKLKSPDLALSNPLEYVQQLVAFIQDGIIGHPDKKTNLRLEGNNLVAGGEEVKAKGLGGYLNSKVSGILKTTGFLAAVLVMKRAVLGSLDTAQLTELLSLS